MEQGSRLDAEENVKPTEENNKHFDCNAIQGSSPQQPKVSVAQKSLYVGNLDSSVTEEHLTELFTCNSTKY